MLSLCSYTTGFYLVYTDILGTRLTISQVLLRASQRCFRAVYLFFKWSVRLPTESTANSRLNNLVTLTQSRACSTGKTRVALVDIFLHVFRPFAMLCILCRHYLSTAVLGCFKLFTAKLNCFLNQFMQFSSHACLCSNNDCLLKHLFLHFMFSRFLSDSS